MLVRHQWVRDHGTPRISVLAGPPRVAAVRWGEWLRLLGGKGKGARFWQAPTVATEAWVLAAANEAVAVCRENPHLPLAIGCSRTALEAFLRSRGDRISAILRDGLIVLPRRTNGIMTVARRRGAARSLAELSLFEALEATPSTRGRFELNGRLARIFGNTSAEIDLLSRRDAIAIEIDGYHHFADAKSYRRDRRKDALLQVTGHMVLRFLAEDVVVDARPAVRAIVEAMARRARAKGSR